MSFVDILIPLVVGLALLIFPAIFMGKRTTEEQKKQKQRLFKKLGWGLIGVSIMYLVSKAIIGASGYGGVDLQSVVKEVNKSAPTMLDVDTRFEKVTAHGRQLIYHFTLVNHREAAIDKGAFSKEVEKIYKSKANTDQTFLNLLDKGISLNFTYYSADNMLLASVTIPAKGGGH